MYYLGFTLLILGVLAKLFFKKSAFERRNEAGVEEFSNYWAMLAVKFLEGSSTFIIIASIALIIIGDFTQ